MNKKTKVLGAFTVALSAIVSPGAVEAAGTVTEGSKDNTSTEVTAGVVGGAYTFKIPQKIEFTGITGSSTDADRTAEFNITLGSDSILNTGKKLQIAVRGPSDKLALTNGTKELNFSLDASTNGTNGSGANLGAGHVTLEEGTPLYTFNPLETAVDVQAPTILKLDDTVHAGSYAGELVFVVSEVDA